MAGGRSAAPADEEVSTKRRSAVGEKNRASTPTRREGGLTTPLKDDMAPANSSSVVADRSQSDTKFPNEALAADRPMDALGVFTFLWSQVMLLQVMKLMHPIRQGRPLTPTMVFWPAFQLSACLWGAVQPRSSPGLLYLLLVSIIVMWITGSQSNHVFIDIAVCFGVLMSYSRERKLWQVNGLSAVRSLMVALYSVTSLHKMNSDWGDARHSCCTLMLAGVLALPPFRWVASALPSSAWAAAPHMATATELMLPLLLQLGWCDRATTVLGCLFHLFICLMLPPMSVYPFSVLMAALYVCIIPAEAAAIFAYLRRWFWGIVAIYSALAAVWMQLMTTDFQPGDEPFEYPPYGGWAPGVVWCLVVNIILILATVVSLGAHAPSEGEEDETKSLRLRVPFRAKVPAMLLFVFGLSPYLGLRTYPALAMFSNLRTEGGRSNHLFIADDFDLVGWQRDFVTIHETNISSLRLAQVDLGALFTPATKDTLRLASIESDFWITPPLEAWPYPEPRPFQGYSIPYLEFRRRLADMHRSGGSGFVAYTRTIAKPSLAWPWLRAYAGIAVQQEDLVLENLTYDVARGGDDELEAPLPQWLSRLARFRTFDTKYSPCRH
eukprot:TRINITY_DN74227_c0_g1_i1.p1 TRINITY_DN74227_c0_g1~~TRINITY_DN74227_c0_g1_i1.p1  ORF type:complete len:608 (-),score=73.12 TRINITY_DN74227_c0_g1_i1:94-1917(-)